MKAYAGLDVSQRETRICIVDRHGEVIEEFTAPTKPELLGEQLLQRGHRYVRVGLESCGIADWLYEGLAQMGLPIICIEARHAHGVLKARTNKTDRNDARGIAAIMQAGFYRPVHVKSAACREIRSLLAARRLLRTKIIDVENGIAGLLSTSGHAIARSRGRRVFETQVFALAQSEPDFSEWLPPLLAARATLCMQFSVIDDAVKRVADADPICRRLMTAPGVGPLVAMTYRVAIDIPTRFPRSRTVGSSRPDTDDAAIGLLGSARPHLSTRRRSRQERPISRRRFGASSANRSVSIESLGRDNRRTAWAQKG